MSELETTNLIKKIIFDLCSENISDSAKLIQERFDYEFPYTFNLIIAQMIFLSFITKRNCKVELYLDFLKEIEVFEETKKINYKIFDIFTFYLLRKFCSESNYLIAMLIELGIFNHQKFEVHETLYFMQYITNMSLEKINKIDYRNKFVKYIKENYKELSKNDFALHKKLIKEGFVPLSFSMTIIHKNTFVPTTKYINLVLWCT